MGIHYSAAIFVGLPRKEMEDVSDLDAMLDDDHLTECAASFDTNGDPGNIIGICIADASSPQEHIPAPEETAAARSTFYGLTGLHAKVWLSLNVS